MGEIINFPDNYQNSDILKKISLPKNDHVAKSNLEETKRLQKMVSNLDDSEEKRKKKKSDQVQKDK
ncbi:hypothetical protein ABE871_17455 [Enterococcus gilvus]|uniref:hypothetical protein n=1 Tax=Enterococcus gilvus TaxID=160453 RepID=UPI003D6B05F3